MRRVSERAREITELWVGKSCSNARFQHCPPSPAMNCGFVLEKQQPEQLLVPGPASRVLTRSRSASGLRTWVLDCWGRGPRRQTVLSGPFCQLSTLLPLCTPQWLCLCLLSSRLAVLEL